MARLDALPSIDIIHGFRGVLDFYLWKGLPCVRKWPVTPPSRVNPKTRIAAALFGSVIRAYSLVDAPNKAAYDEDAADQPRTGRDIYVSAVFGRLHEEIIPEPPPPPEEEMYDAYVCLRDKKPQNTPGGDFAPGAWRTRDINDEQADPAGICAIAANQIILAPGSYRCTISCPGHDVGYHQARLYNLTAASVLLLGTSQYTHPGNWVTTPSLIVGRFVVAATQTLEIQHQCSVVQLGSGFGAECDFTDEIYTVAEFWREAETP